MIEDAELLRRYADDRSQEAFAELVRRRVNLVYSVALRQVGGDAHLAQDVTQRVFTDLARKAKQLAQHAVLSGWLYRGAQFAATDVVRAERRRRVREQEAHIMNETSSPDSPVDWEKFRPLLDEALGELDETDRDAVALRFFEERSFADIGAALRLNENAARKRVARALDKLHGLLARRGVTSTTAALSLALVGQTSVAAPAGLAASVASGALAGTAGVSVMTTFLGFMSTSKIGLGVVGLIACVAVGTAVFEAKAVEKTRSDLAAADQAQAALQAKLREAQNQLAVQSRRAAEAEADTDRLLQVVRSLPAAPPPAVAAARVRITQGAVEERYKRARELAQSGQSEEALKEFLWCFDEGMRGLGGFSGVRRSYVLSEIEKIGPAGIAALQERRDAAQKRVLEGEKDFDTAADFSALNRVLKQNDLTLAVYDQLSPGDERRRSLAGAAYEQLVSARRYSDAMEARNYGQMSSMLELNMQERPLPPGAPNAERMRQMQREYAVKAGAQSVEVLAGAGDLVNARKLAARVIAFDGSSQTKAIIQEHATRAGQPGLLSEGAP